MKFIHILVEGQTEETFVREVLVPHLIPKNLSLSFSLVTTKRVKSGSNFKGGVTSYGKVKGDLRRLLQNTNFALVTTMLDYYNLPGDFPGLSERSAGDCYARVQHLEQAFRDDINDRRFLPYLALHDFEAMLFASPEAINHAFAPDDKLPQLQKIRTAFPSPEEINEADPPAERLRALFATYQKPFHGPLIVAEIGLDPIRQACLHFSTWLKALEELAGE